MRRGALVLVLLLLGTSAPPFVHAQDAELMPAILVLNEDEEGFEAEADSLQIYRIPVSFTLRSLETQRWGLRLILPVSVGTHDLRASKNARELAERIETITIVPEAEMLFRAGPRWVLKPFVSTAFADSTSNLATDPLFSLGTRAIWRREYARATVQAGGAARYSSSPSNRIRISDYTTVEAGVDI